MDRETARAFGRMSEKMNELGQRIDSLFVQLHQENVSNIDYIAMETGVDLDQEEVIEDE